MFTYPTADRRKRLKARESKAAQRARVLWLQDQITLATFHGRPHLEVDTLLRDLAATIKKDDSWKN